MSFPFLTCLQEKKEKSREPTTFALVGEKGFRRIPKNLRDNPLLFRPFQRVLSEKFQFPL